MKVCAEPDCPTLTTTTRCPDHTRARDKTRGTRQQRGYDAAHDRLRAAWQTRLNAGEVVHCWRCEQPIDGPFDLGHDDTDRTIYRGPEHIKCNRGTSSRR